MTPERIQYARKAIVCFPLACDDRTVAGDIASLLTELVDEVGRLQEAVAAIRPPADDYEIRDLQAAVAYLEPSARGDLIRRVVPMLVARLTEAEEQQKTERVIAQEWEERYNAAIAERGDMALVDRETVVLASMLLAMHVEDPEVVRQLSPRLWGTVAQYMAPMLSRGAHGIAALNAQRSRDSLEIIKRLGVALEDGAAPVEPGPTIQ